MRGDRIVVTALDGRDVAETERTVVDTDQRVGERIDVLELAGGAHEHAVVGGGQRARWRDAVLRIDRLAELLRRDAKARQLRVGDLDVDVLIRIAEIIDLADARHAQQHRAQLVRVVVQLRGGKAVALERVDVGVDVAEFVVEERALNAGRQGRRDIADFLADLIPGFGYVLDRRRVFHREEHQRFAGARVTAHEIDGGRFLQFAADPVGDLFLHLARGCAGPKVRITITLNVNGGSSDWARRV